MSQEQNDPTAKEQKSSTLVRLLRFSMGPEDYALPLTSVREVIDMPHIRPIPQSPEHILGIMDLRGDVVSVIDLRKKLGIKKFRSDEENVVIIVDIGNAMVGALVDCVDGVAAIPQQEIAAPPHLEGQKSQYICGVARQEKSLVVILDLAKALNIQDLETIHGQVQKKLQQAA